MKRILTAMACLVLIAACQKDGGIAPDPQQVTFTITSPAPGQLFRSGDTVAIHATVRYPGQLHGYELKLVDSASGMVVYDVARHVHADSFAISERWVSGASQPAVIHLSITASIDHDGGQGTQRQSFSVIP